MIVMLMSFHGWTNKKYTLLRKNNNDGEVIIIHKMNINIKY